MDSLIEVKRLFLPYLTTFQNLSTGGFAEELKLPFCRNKCFQTTNILFLNKYACVYIPVWMSCWKCSDNKIKEFQNTGQYLSMGKFPINLDSFCTTHKKNNFFPIFCVAISQIYMNSKSTMIFTEWILIYPDIFISNFIYYQFHFYSVSVWVTISRLEFTSHAKTTTCTK